ncbi:MAG: hypothetical protein JSU81_07820 [Candidatus Coatesbacteria bacterium]|nr:MAG: hypothetical protein JSU81_07820 [Candidatus Coatesbacteria bacterium]
MPSKKKPASWRDDRERLDRELLRRAPEIYKKLAELAAGGDLKAIQLVLKELGEADGRAGASGGGVELKEITYDVVPPNNKRKGRQPKKKS